jgi:SAM-dependent methyltransferase
MDRQMDARVMPRTVAEVFHSHQGRLTDKWSHYLAIYQRYFADYVGKAVRVLEIGVSHGGSLQLWKRYFGAWALIVGVDIDPRCKAYEESQIQVEIGDQGDSGFWEGLWDHYQGFDIVIDDGSHRKSDQEAAFKALWPSTRGVYLIEDIHREWPDISAPDGFLVSYPWVLVAVRPKRLIRGTPSRELNEAEREAVRLYSDV